MATMTHCDPVHVPAYASASALCMQLTRPLFEQAMTASAIADPQDKFYKAWWTMRETAAKFTENRSLELPLKDQQQFEVALYVAHRTGHMHANEAPFPSECDCDVARTISSIHQLMAGRIGRRR